VVGDNNNGFEISLANFTGRLKDRSKTSEGRIEVQEIEGINKSRLENFIGIIQKVSPEKGRIKETDGYRAARTTYKLDDLPKEQEELMHLIDQRDEGKKQILGYLANIVKEFLHYIDEIKKDPSNAVKLVEEIKEIICLDLSKCNLQTSEYVEYKKLQHEIYKLMKYY
jgi:hypothetical protein